MMKYLVALALLGFVPGAHGAVSDRDRAELGIEKNLLPNGGCESGKAGWATYDDGAATAPVNGTGGTVSVTMSTTTSSPIDGRASCLFTKDAANRQGEGWSYEFTLQKTATPHTVIVDYQIASGTYDAGSDTTDSDITVWLFTPSETIIQLAPYKMLGATSGTNMRFVGRFQSESSGSNYRLIFHQAKSGTSAYTVKVEAKVVAESKTYGPPVTDWTSYTPTLSWVTGISSNVARYRRIGDSIEIEGKISTSGAVTSAALTVSLPSGLSVDTSKFSGGAAENGTLGLWSGIDAGMNVYEGRVAYQSTTTVGFAAHNTSGTYATPTGVTQAAPFTWGATDELFYKFSVPISGWSSTVQMSSDTDTRVVAFRGYKTSNQGPFSTETKLTGYTTNFDTHAAWDATNHRYNFPVPGKYRVTIQTNSIPSTTANQAAGYKLTGGSTVYIGAANANDASSRFGGSDVLDVVAGDYLEVYQWTNANTTVQSNSTNTFVAIERLSGPSQIAATETVAARYTSALGESTSGAADLVVNYSTKDFDSHGAVSTGTGTWKFTAPIAGKYRISAAAAINTASATLVEVAIWKTGVRQSLFQLNAPATSSNYQSMISDTVNMAAGDYLQVKLNTGATRTMVANAEFNWVSIERIGN